MKIAVVGSRDFPNKIFVKDTVKSFLVHPTYTIVSGGARGVDTWAEEVAKELVMQTIIFKADWATFGKGAGFMRNEKIINEADLVLAFWDGESSGTKHSIDLAMKNNKPINIYVRTK